MEVNYAVAAPGLNNLSNEPIMFSLVAGVPRPISLLN